MAGTDFALEEPSLFNPLKDQFLAGVYTEDGAAARHALKTIIERADAAGSAFSETDEKILRQVQVAARRFPRLVSPDLYQKLKDCIRKPVLAQSVLVDHLDYDTWAAALDLHPWQMDRLFQTAVTFQLTKGCSNFCRRCNEWALPKVRRHFSYDAVSIILEKLAEQENHDLALYGASDPLDWSQDSRTFEDIVFLTRPKTTQSILTKVPRQKENLVKALVAGGIDFSVSLTRLNRKRIHQIEQEMGKPLTRQHDTDDLLIPAGLDEDFASVKPSITDAYGSEIAPEGAFIIIPTFTSALHPMGHQKIKITKNTPFFPKKRLGRQALLKDYFKPIEGMGSDSSPFFLDTLLPVQVETILLDNGSDDLTPPGMRSLKEYFTIFDHGPRQKRKKMTRSVLRHMKTKYLEEPNPCRFKDLSPDRKVEFKAKIQAHLDLCRKDHALKAKKVAAAYFLTAAARYLKANPVKREIIRFLVREEISRLSEEFKDIQIAESNPEALLFDSPFDFYAVFRFLLTALICQKACPELERFIRSTPTGFDPVSDRFILLP